MKIIYHLFVSGLPKAQPRPRAAKNGHFYNPHSADSWKRSVQAAFIAYRKPEITCGVSIDIKFFFPKPQRLKKTAGVIAHTVKPDADNLEKATWDALTEIGVWKDDALVFRHTSEKYYSDSLVGAEITIQIEET